MVIDVGLARQHTRNVGCFVKATTSTGPGRPAQRFAYGYAGAGAPRFMERAQALLDAKSSGVEGDLCQRLSWSDAGTRERAGRYLEG